MNRQMESGGGRKTIDKQRKGIKKDKENKLKCEKQKKERNI